MEGNRKRSGGKRPRSPELIEAEESRRPKSADDHPTRARNPEHPDQPLAAAAANDDDVVLERENTAWDVLEARFKLNAQEGNYFDLTDETAGDGGRALSVADAEQAVEAMRRSDAEHADGTSAPAFANEGSSNSHVPVAAADVAAAAAAAAATEPSPATSISELMPRQSPIIRSLNNMIHDTIADLQQAREHLLAAVQERRRSRSLQGLVSSIQRRTNRMQAFVNRHANEVVESTMTVERLEKMNLLVLKANALIDAVNGGSFRNTANPSCNRQNGKDGGGRENGNGGSGGRSGGGNSGGGNNEVIVID